MPLILVVPRPSSKLSVPKIRPGSAASTVRKPAASEAVVVADICVPSLMTIELAVFASTLEKSKIPGVGPEPGSKMIPSASGESARPLITRLLAFTFSGAILAALTVLEIE